MENLGSRKGMIFMSVASFDAEVEKGYKSLLSKRTGELEKLKLSLQELKDEIGECIALQELYKHRTYAKGHKGFEHKIKEQRDKYAKLVIEYDKKESEYRNKIKQLEFDIESLKELLESPSN